MTRDVTLNYKVSQYLKRRRNRESEYMQGSEGHNSNLDHYSN